MGKSVSRGSVVQAVDIPIPSSPMSSSHTLYTAFSSSCGCWQSTSFICALWKSSVPALASLCPCCTDGRASSCPRSGNGSVCLLPQKPPRFHSERDSAFCRSIPLLLPAGSSSWPPGLSCSHTQTPRITGRSFSDPAISGRLNMTWEFPFRHPGDRMKKKQKEDPCLWNITQKNFQEPLP